MMSIKERLVCREKADIVEELNPSEVILEPDNIILRTDP
jgi:hypothetical protein